MMRGAGRRHETYGERRRVRLLYCQYHRIVALLTVAVALLGTACQQQEVSKPLPIQLTREHACAVCGMIVVDLAGPKGQIHYRSGKVDTFCTTLHMFSFYHQPDSPKNILAIYVNDMGTTEVTHPEGEWVAAAHAFYALGGDIMGPHGEALAPFSGKEDAEDYIRDHGGKILRFDEVTMDMVKQKRSGSTHGHSM